MVRHLNSLTFFFLFLRLKLLLAGVKKEKSLFIFFLANLRHNCCRLSSRVSVLKKCACAGVDRISLTQDNFEGSLLNCLDFRTLFPGKAWVPYRDGIFENRS